MAGPMELFSVAAKLFLDRSEYDSDVKEADRSGKTLAENLSNYMEKAKKVISALGVGLMIKKAAGSIWDLAKETSAAGDRIDKQSQALGMSRKAYQEWDYILAQSGASIDSMGMSMKTMNEAIHANSAETAAGLSKLGLSAAHLQSLSPEDQFETLVRAFQKMPAGAEKSRLAMQLFGRNAQSLMPLLNSSSDSIDELRKNAHDLGLIMSDEDVDASVAFGDALDDLGRTWNSLKYKIGAQLLPGFTGVIKNLTTTLGNISTALVGAIKTGDWGAFFQTITTEIENLIPGMVDTVVKFVTGLFENADKLVGLAVSIITGIVNGIIDSLPILIEKLPTIINTIWEGEDGQGGLKALALKLGNWVIDEINKAFGLNLPHIEDIEFPSWEDIKAGAEIAWRAIQQGLNSLVTTLGKFVFGERDDGSVDWPTWEDVGTYAQLAWQGIKDGLSAFATTIGKFVFGERDDGSINWPTWDDVSTFAQTAWQGIKDGLSALVTSIGKFVFGERDDGSIDWPTWEDVQSFAITAWQGIKDGLAGLVQSIGKFIFGETDDGAVKWPTWTDVGLAARNAWQSIVTGLQNLVAEIGKFIFGSRDDSAAIDWPSWDDVKAFAEKAWNSIKEGLTGFATMLGAFVFGVRDDGAIDWPTWDDVKALAEKAWQGIKDGLASLVTSVGKFIFGERDDGAIDWPTWDDVGALAESAWQGIKDGLASLVTSIGKFVFGERDDGSVDWPTWDDVKEAASSAWKGIKSGLANLAISIGHFIFGKRNDGSIKWPTWDDVKDSASSAWKGIKEGLSGLATSIGKFVFGSRDDGSVAWPTWDSLKDGAIAWWQGDDGNGGIKGQIKSIAKWALGLLNLPTWSEVVTQITNWWNEQVLPNLKLGFNVVFNGVFGGGLFGGGPAKKIAESTLSVPEGSPAGTPFIVDMSGQSGGGGRGGFAKGLNYAPFDGYALIHRGETILNQNQGREWRQNGGASGINSQQLYGVVASAVADAVRDIQINLDGRAVGDAVAGQVGRNLYQSQRGRRFA